MTNDKDFLCACDYHGRQMLKVYCILSIMELDTAQQILVIILASALAVFLILAITVVVLVIRLLQKLRLIADKAEKVVETAGSLGDMFKKTTGTVGLFRFVQSVVGMVQQKRSNKE